MARLLRRRGRRAVRLVLGLLALAAVGLVAGAPTATAASPDRAARIDVPASGARGPAAVARVVSGSRSRGSGAAAARGTTAGPVAAPGNARVSVVAPVQAAGAGQVTAPSQLAAPAQMDPPPVAAPAVAAPAVGQPVAAPAGAPAAGPDCQVLRCVALTFDDGPEPGTTGRLLDYLAQARVPATFFVVGSKVPGHPDLVARMAADGHEIGNHTWTHAFLPKTSTPDALEQVARTQEAVTRVTGRAPTLLRPPFGAFTSRDLQLGLPVVIWDVDPVDWKTRNTEQVVGAVLAQTRSGSIVLMHDTLPTTVAAVPAIVASLRARGYTLVTVSQLLGAPQPGRVYARR
ncbi:MAG TPA: polysaccharide deacetylase family protein [Dermatophilaceae bacterium]|nr:polysaccharide deacetylase family protein [Dermatophilaceae bacterium]